MLLNKNIIEKLNSVQDKFKKLERDLEDPELIKNMEQYQKVVKQRSDIENVVERFNRYLKLDEEIADAKIMLKEETDAEMIEMAETELEDIRLEQEELGSSILTLLLPKDPLDEKNIFLEIRAGTGGNEAGLFAADLLKMYSKYAEKHKWKIEVLNSNITGVGGFKEVIISFTGKNCYSFLKFESGVHRVQRVPATETSGRVHTSTVTVAVLPEVEEIDVEIDPKEVRVDTFCSSGPGGQSVNTTYSAIRLTHIPTGLVVSCQDEKSQIKNKAKAMRVLRSRVMKLENEKKDLEISEQRRSMVGSGGRSEKIKTYNFAQNRVTDHRMGLTVYNLEIYLQGEIEDMINKMRAFDTAEQLKSLFL